MEKQNVTLALPKELLHKAKRLAVERHISLSGLLVEALRALVEQEDRYLEAKQRQLRWLEEGFDFGLNDHIDWKREDLHERNTNA